MSTILAGEYDIRLYRRQDWIQKINYTDSNGTAINLSGYSIISQVWNKERTKKYVDITSSISNFQTGEITMSLTDTQTTNLPDLSYYDLRVTYGTTSYYVISGTITALEGYSA